MNVILIIMTLAAVLVGLGLMAGCFITIWYFPEIDNAPPWSGIATVAGFFLGGSMGSTMKNFLGRIFGAEKEGQ